ncbi:hypothetical protein BB561_002374 [Smittium simulii]|uniref:Exportin-1/Importin-beta-like domain-containing protein n=1 Tax=Smittium simulii TaxID=133385 RepID=A0A2T9YQP9_9FUNG|nr:hypothetical protein BB561_002374 [Smittium simulii]
MLNNNLESLDSTRKAIQVTYAMNSTEEARAQANSFINSLRYSKGCGIIGFELLAPSENNSPQLRYLGWQLVEDEIKQFGNQGSMNPELLLQQLKLSLSAFHQNEPLEYLILKAAKATVAAVLRLWPNGIWADFPLWIFQALNNKFLALQILQTLTEEIIEFKSDPIVTLQKNEYNSGLTVAILPLNIIQELYPYGFKAEDSNYNPASADHSSNTLELIKPIPGNENGWLLILLDTLSSSNSDPRIKISILNTFQHYLKWLPFIAIQKVPQIISVIINSISESNLSYELYKTVFECLISLCTRSYSSPVEKFQISSLLVDEYLIQSMIYKMAQLFMSPNLDTIDLEPSQVLELFRMGTYILSSILENLVWYKKSSGFVPEKISQVVSTLLFITSSNYPTVNDIAFSGIAVMQNNTTMMLERLDNQLLLSIKNSCIDKLINVFHISVNPEIRRHDDDYNWEDETNGVYGGNFENYSDYEVFIMSRYKKKITDVLQIMAKLDPQSFSQIVVESFQKYNINNLAENNLLTNSSTSETKSTPSESLIHTCFALVDISAKSFDLYIKSLDESNQNLIDAALTAALPVFEMLLKYKSEKPNIVKLQLSNIESFLFLIEKKNELIMLTLEELTVYLSRPASKSIAENDEWTRVSYRAASVLEKMVKTNPALFYRYYFDFINLALAKESTNDTQTRVRIMLWEIPLAFLTTNVPEVPSINPQFNTQELTKNINDVLSDMTTKFCQIESVLENTEHMFETLGINKLDSPQTTLEDWIATKSQRRVLGFLVQKTFAFVKPLGNINRDRILSSQNPEFLETDNQFIVSPLYKNIFEEFSPSIIRTALLLARVLHACFNVNLTKSVKWKEFLASRTSALYCPKMDSEEYKECAILFVFITQMLEYVYKIIGSLCFTTSVYYKIENFGTFWTTCLFGEAPYLPLVTWKSMIDSVIQKSVLANTVSTTYKIPNYKLSTQFFAGFYYELNKFMSLTLTENWKKFEEIRNQGLCCLFEAELRSLTRVFADLVSSFFYGVSSCANNSIAIEKTVEKKNLANERLASNSAGEYNTFSALAMVDQNTNFNSIEENKKQKRIKPNLNILHYFSNNQKDFMDVIGAAKVILDAEDTTAARKIVDGVESFLVPILSIVCIFSKSQYTNLNETALKNLQELSVDNFWEFYKEVTSVYYDNTALKHLDQNLVYSLYASISEWLSSDFYSSMIKMLSSKYQLDLQDRVLTVIASISRSTIAQKKYFRIQTEEIPSNIFVQSLKAGYINTSMLLMGAKYDYIDDTKRIAEFFQQLNGLDKVSAVDGTQSKEAVKAGKEPRIMFMAAKRLFEKIINLSELNNGSVVEGSKKVAAHKKELASNQRVFGTNLYSGKKSVGADVLDSEANGFEDSFKLGDIIP